MESCVENPMLVLVEMMRCTTEKCDLLCKYGMRKRSKAGGNTNLHRKISCVVGYSLSSPSYSQELHVEVRHGIEKATKSVGSFQRLGKGEKHLKLQTVKVGHDRCERETSHVE